MGGLQVLIRRAKAEGRNVMRYLDPRGVGNDVARTTDFNQCLRPVLLLPGFMATRRGLSVLERRLRRDGYGVFSLNLGGLMGTFNTHSIEESALLVREKIEKLYRRYPALGPLTIVGHSKGGLIGRYYIKRMGGHERCAALVTLGTPHHGTPAAYLGALMTGLVAPSIWQLMPMSPFIRRLKSGDFPDRVRLVSVYSKEDGVVPFPSGMVEPGARADIVNIEIAGVSHRAFLTRKAVYDAVQAQLRLVYPEGSVSAPDLLRTEQG